MTITSYEWLVELIAGELRLRERLGELTIVRHAGFVGSGGAPEYSKAFDVDVDGERLRVEVSRR